MFRPRARTFAPILTVTLTLAVAACGTDEAGPEPEPDAEPRATWYQDVAPIVHSRCAGCHTEGGIAPFTLESYDDASPIAAFMLSKVEAGEMPPWSAASGDGCETRLGWQEDARLTDDELQILRDWVAGGAPAGDPDSAAPLPGTGGEPLADITHSLAPQTPYTTSGTIDQQICFVLDPELAELHWMTGVQFVPGNLEVVHHAVLLAVVPEQADNVRALGGADGTFDCFGAVGLEGTYALGFWVPGARPFETPAGTGIPLLPGSVMLMNIHYHPTGLDHEPDSTSVDLRLTAEQPERTFVMSALGNADQAPILQPGPNDRGVPEFRIPANVRDHTERMVFDIQAESPDRIPVTAMFPHMHYVGVSMSVKITRANPAPGEPAEECLLNIPRWDFDWQRTYFYDTDIAGLPTIGDGDTVEIDCLYDNTLANPYVARMLEEENLTQPIDVHLGDETTDEMCLIGMGLIL